MSVSTPDHPDDAVASGGRVDADGRGSGDTLLQDRRNGRLRNHLIAWAEILEALGWCVAIRFPAGPVYLGKVARERLFGGHARSGTWEEICAHLAEKPASGFLVSTGDAQIWADVVPEQQPADQARAAALLSKRETEIIEWLLEGKTCPETAAILNCSRRTVENHVSKLYRKFGVRTRTQLLFAIRGRNFEASNQHLRNQKVSRGDLSIFNRMLDRLTDITDIGTLESELRAMEERCRLLVIWTELARVLNERGGFPLTLSEFAPLLGTREARILSGLIRGESREHIARHLHWRRDTLDRHLGSLRERLGFGQITHLMNALTALRPCARMEDFRPGNGGEGGI